MQLRTTQSEWKVPLPEREVAVTLARLKPPILLLARGQLRASVANHVALRAKRVLAWLGRDVGGGTRLQAVLYGVEAAESCSADNWCRSGVGGNPSPDRPPPDPAARSSCACTQNSGSSSDRAGRSSLWAWSAIIRAAPVQKKGAKWHPYRQKKGPHRCGPERLLVLNRGDASHGAACTVGVLCHCVNACTSTCPTALVAAAC